MEFVLNMDIDGLFRPLDKSKMIEDLHLSNPIIADLVEVWIRIRRERMVFT